MNRSLLAVSILAGMLIAGAAQAQPARIDNIWGGLDHQPTRAAVAPLERQAGIAASNQQQLDQRLEQLSNRLLTATSVHVPTDIASSTERG
jgi:ABC-type phosphate/phosphonate transport system substrate-binding protein